MPELSKLNLIASRLLCALLLTGETFNDLPIEGQMSKVGVAKRMSYYDARKELEAAGWIRVERQAGRQALIYPLESSLQSATMSPSTSVPPPSELARDTYVINYVLHDSPVPPAKPSLDQLVPLEVATLNGTTSPKGSYLESTYPLESSYPESTYYPEGSYPEWGYHSNGRSTQGSHPEVLEERCRAADEMDESGDVMVRTSPSQARRKVQVPLVQEAYKLFFPKDNALTEKSAKEFLSWNDNSAFQVYQELERIARVKPDLSYPLAYVRKVFKAEAEKRPAPPRSSLQTAKPNETSPLSPLWDGEQMEPSEDWKAKAERARAYAREKWGEE